MTGGVWDGGKDRSINMSLNEWRELLEWMHEHGYNQQPGESLDHWRKRTGDVSYAYALIAEAACDHERDEHRRVCTKCDVLMPA